MAFTFAAFSYIVALIVDAFLIFFAIFHVSSQLERGLRNFDLTYVWPVNWPFWLVNQSIDHSNISLLERATFTPQEALLSPLQKNCKLFSNIWYLIVRTLLSFMQLLWQLYFKFWFFSKLSRKMVQMTSFLSQYIQVSLTGHTVYWAPWSNIQKVWMVIDWSLNGKVPALLLSNFSRTGCTYIWSPLAKE